MILNSTNVQIIERYVARDISRLKVLHNFAFPNCVNI